MSDSLDSSDLAARLELIQSMLAAGRRTTESWGWSLLLWGVAYYVAIAWAAWTPATWYGPALAWPVTMTAAGLLTGLLASRKTRAEAETTLGRAVGAIWMGMGASMFVLFLAMGFSRHFGMQVFVPVVCAFLGSANATSGLLLRWRAQLACAVVWWSAAAAACFASEQQVSWIFLAAIFFCQIVFGLYAMRCDARARQRLEAHHG